MTAHSRPSPTGRRGRRVLASAAVGILAISGLATACGDDESSSTSTTIESGGGSGSSGSSGSDGSNGSDAPETEFSKEVEARGEPTVAAVEGPVGELQITDDVVGTGAAATESSTVTAQYVGAVAATGEVFQSSWEMNGAVSFPLDQVIPGWSDGLQGMKEGGRRTLVIPAAMAYGANPPQGSGIPANADLVFVVDLVAVD